MSDSNTPETRRLLLSELNAACCLSISIAELRKEVRKGTIRRRLIDGRAVYHTRDLVAFVDSLPYEGESQE